MHEICSRLTPDHLVVWAPRGPRSTQFDCSQPYRITRVPHSDFSAYWAGRRRRVRVLGGLSRLVGQYGVGSIQAAATLPDGILAWALHRIWGIPYLVYAYGLDFLAPMNSAWGRFYTSRVLTHADHVVAVSHYTRSQLEDVGVAADRITVIHPGVDADRFCPADDALSEQVREGLGLRGRRVILTVGNLVRRKGHDMVLRAMPSVLWAMPDAAYLIVGDGVARGELEREVWELGLQGHVIFAGRVPGEQLVRFYQSADLFVMPSRDIAGDVEGFGIVYLEAGCCGLPAIGGRSGGIADAVVDGQTGILVDSLCPEAVADAIVTLLGDPYLARAMGRAGRERAMHEFTWPRAADQVEATLAGLDRREPQGRLPRAVSGAARLASFALRRDMPMEA